MLYSDQNLKCRDCGKDFVWGAGEQKFFAEKGFTVPPIRCSDCRKKKRAKYQGKPLESNASTPSISDEKHSIKCKNCGKVSEVPFKPQFPDDVLCAECFEKEFEAQK